MTADAAVRGIRELDPNGSIGMIGSETDMPYARPPLSKGMWNGRPFETGSTNGKNQNAPIEGIETRL